MILAEVIPGIFFQAELDALWLRRAQNNSRINLPQRETWEPLIPKSSHWASLPFAIDQLLEMGLAEGNDGDIRFNYHDLPEVEKQGFYFLDYLSNHSPFVLAIESSGSLGRGDFKYAFRFFWGNSEVPLEIRGCFAKYRNTIYRLDAQTYALVDEIKKFNLKSPEEKSKGAALIIFGKIKELASGIGAQLDKYLGENEVILPNRTSIDLVQDENGAITMVPRYDGTNDDMMQKMFLRLSDVQDVYDLDDAKGKRVRVVLDDEQQEILRRIQQVRHVAGITRKKILADPNSIFDGIDSEKLDLGLYGKRVKGIGDFAFTAVPYASYTRSGILDNGFEDDSIPQKIGLKLKVPGDESEELVFNNPSEVFLLKQKLEAARQSVQSEIEFKGKRILVTDEFIFGIQELEDRIKRRTKNRADSRDKSKGKYVLIYTNYESLEYSESVEATQKLPAPEIPANLNPEVKILLHQKDGISWLQRKYKSHREGGGALLADDMGLGKTFQILAFIAWCIEKGYIKRDSGNIETPPWNPILIIMPLMLLEMDTWLSDAKKFFRNGGTVFQPVFKADHNSLRKLRTSESSKETEIGQPVLNISQFYNYRIVLTNYETILNYQHSFAQVDWSIIVTDEAQRYKTPNSKISHALKALKTSFRVGATGTPVENRLLDLWNLADFLQPGLLGSAKDFSDKFEKPLVNFEDSNSVKQVTDNLRCTLMFGKSNSFFIRREKGKELTELPLKEEKIIESFLSDEIWNKHCQIIQRAKRNAERGEAFKAISDLSKLYQHPWLLEKEDSVPMDLHEAVKISPKLQSIIDLLDKIANNKEKAIIFAWFIKMQTILSLVLENHFDKKVEIINGDFGDGTTKRNSKIRKEIIDRFSQSSGFDILILSPRVAGLGLTITAANHVIHYGRWWNPAIELQCTDRVYRIGQSKPVHVYLPISKSRNGLNKTFDEKLHAIIEKKLLLAKDFLCPMPDESTIGHELEQEILEDVPSSSRVSHVLTADDLQRMNPDEFEALLAAIFYKQDYNVILTPKTNDGGTDVIARRKDTIILIQCKHIFIGILNSDSAVNELLRALDLFRCRSGLSIKDWQMIVATNVSATPNVEKFARHNECKIMNGEECLKMIQKHKISFADLDRQQGRRCHTLSEVISQLQLLK